MILRHDARHRRPGLSLLEVLAATAIFIAAIAVISQAISLSTDQAVEVAEQTQGINLAQAKLAEVASGAVQPESQGQSTYGEDELGDDAERWAWSMDVQPANASSGSPIPSTAQSFLNYVTVKIHHQDRTGQWVEVASLSQVILSPTQRGSSLDQQNATLPSTSTSSSSSSSTGSTGTTGSPGTTPTTGGK